MSYEVLARKWRPSRFEELVGQDHVVRILSHALEHDRLHHAYLFTGTRGVGKTTVARLLARCLNCEQGISAKPCGDCSACQDISAGRFIDFLEIDAASHTGVDNVRELLDNALYAPVRGRYKVYLIDEAHMLSRQAFNALLITLEEPPSYLKFVLATTDPARVPVTILSRCLQLHLRNLVPEAITEHVADILKAEKVNFEETALRHIARAADGSMRDALSLVDQAIAFGAGNLTTEQVASMLSLTNQDVVGSLLAALADNDVSELLRLAEEYLSGTPDVDALFTAIASLVQKVALAQAAPDAINAQEEDTELIMKLARTLSAEAAQLYYQAALNGRKDLPFAPDPRAALQITLLRMLAFSPLIYPNEDESPDPPTSNSAVRRAVSNKTSEPQPVPKTPASRAEEGVTSPGQQATREPVGTDKITENRKPLADTPEANSTKTQESQGVVKESGATKKLSTKAKPLLKAGREEKIQLYRARKAAAKEIIEKDNIVNTLQQKFNASIKKNSIQPI